MTQTPFASGPSGIRTVRELLTSLDQADRLTQLAEICRLSDLAHRVYRRYGPLAGDNAQEIADAMDRALNLDPTTVDVEFLDQPLRQMAERLQRDPGSTDPSQDELEVSPDPVEQIWSRIQTLPPGQKSTLLGTLLGSGARVIFNSQTQPSGGIALQINALDREALADLLGGAGRIIGEEQTSNSDEEGLPS